MSSVQSVTDADFESEVLQLGQPVLVDFWAPWCGPCRAIAPMIEQLAAENEGSAKVVKVNVDEAQISAKNYNISGIPALCVFKDGDMVNKLVGVRPKSAVQQALDAVK